MQVATLDYDDYLGYVAIGRMHRRQDQDRRPRAARAPRRQEGRVPRPEGAGLQGLKRFEIAEGVAGRHRRGHRHGGAQRRRDHHDIAQSDDPAAAHDRRADHLDAVPRQRRSVRRAGRQVRHHAQPARAPLQGDQVATSRLRVEETDAAERVQGLGPRRAAPVGAHRDDAARGLRAVRVAAARSSSRSIDGKTHRSRTRTS